MNSYDLTVFIEELINALYTVVLVLSDMTFTINGAFISVWDMAIYGGIITVIMSLIKSMSKDGLFTFDGKGDHKRKLKDEY